MCWLQLRQQQQEQAARKGTLAFFGAGVGGTVSCLLDFVWSEQAIIKAADPDEAREEVKMVFLLTRFFLLIIGPLFVAMSGATIVVGQMQLSSILHLWLAGSTIMLGVLVGAVEAWSDAIAGPIAYSGHDWHGPHWDKTRWVFVCSIVCAVIGLGNIAQGTTTSRQPSHLVPLLGTELHHKVFPGHFRKPSSRTWISAGSGLICTGFALVLLGGACYVTQPRYDAFSTLGDTSTPSFLEWHTPGGHFKLGSVADVTWGAEVGLRIVPLKKSREMKNIKFFETVSPKAAFIVSVLRTDKSSPTLSVDNEDEAGEFTFTDRGGLVSTEQIIENVVPSQDGRSITMSGFLYYGPFFLSAASLAEEPIGLPTRTPFSFTLTSRESHNISAGVLEFNIQIGSAQPEQVYIVCKSRPSESLFGLGASYTYMDLKGGIIPIIAREQGVGRGLEPLSFAQDNLDERPGGGSATQTTYTAIPHVTTSHLRSIAFAGTDFMVMDFSQPDRLVFQVNASSATGFLFTARRPIDLVQAYAEHVSGYMRPLPEWTDRGAIVGMQGGRKVVESKLQALRVANVPVSAIWLQDWAGQKNTSMGSRLFWNWEPNEQRYPGWFTWVEQLYKDYGINVLTYVNPYLAVQAPMWHQANQTRCLITRGDDPLEQYSGTRDFRFSTVNLFEERCMTWYAQIIRKNVLGGASTPKTRKGAMGWMADFGELLPFDVQPSGKTKASGGEHNAFPGLWAETNRRAIAADPFSAENTVFFTRSANAISPKYTTLQWMGDQLGSWDANDGLHSALIGQLSAGLSGVAYSHSDIGGYTMLKRAPFTYVRTLQLFKRWMELSAFSDAVFRTHEGNLPGETWQVWDEPLRGHFALFATVHTLLHKVRRKVQDKEPGLPLIRSTWMHFPHDQQTTSLKTQFFLGGRDILVCPVLAHDQEVTPCYIPRGLNLRHVFIPDFDVHTPEASKWISCPAPLGRPCVLFACDRPDLRVLATKIQALL